jgi:hypothetical protein
MILLQQVVTEFYKGLCQTVTSVPHCWFTKLQCSPIIDWFTSEVELAKPKVEHALAWPTFSSWKKKTNVGKFSFFQKKEQVGKAPIFGSFTHDYHQVSKNWFSHISAVLKKIIERTNWGTSPEPLVICWVFQKAPWNWGLEQKKI